jgi:Holliday junction resolvase RusA-like endonuclease
MTGTSDQQGAPVLDPQTQPSKAKENTNAEGVCPPHSAAPPAVPAVPDVKYTLFIPGEPIPRARPRYYARGRTVGVYDSQKVENALLLAKLKYAASQNMAFKPPETGIESFYVVEWCFGLSIPKSLKNGAFNRVLWNRVPHTKTPDVDNLIKMWDVANGFLWPDDSQIVRMTGTKRYAEKPFTRITVSRYTIKEMDATSEAITMIFSHDELKEFIEDAYRLGSAEVTTECRHPAFQLVGSLVAEFANKYASPLSKLKKEIYGAAKKDVP